MPPLSRLSLFRCLSFCSVSLSLRFLFLFCLSVSLFFCSPCLSVSLSLSVFSPSLFSLSLCFLCLCVLPTCLLLGLLLSTSLLSVSTSPFSFLLCLSFLCPSMFLRSLSFGVLSLSFFPPALLFLCLSVSSVSVCCLLAFCLGCPAVLRGATTKLRISFSGSIYYASGGCGSIMLPPSPLLYSPARLQRREGKFYLYNFQQRSHESVRGRHFIYKIYLDLVFLEFSFFWIVFSGGVGTDFSIFVLVLFSVICWCFLCFGCAFCVAGLCYCCVF